jgi:hypothetical protein
MWKEMVMAEDTVSTLVQIEKHKKSVRIDSVPGDIQLANTRQKHYFLNQLTLFNFNAKVEKFLGFQYSENQMPTCDT